MEDIYRTFSRTYYYILDFIIPRFCVGCGKEHEVFCEKCQSFSYQKWANCLLCGTRNMTGTFCAGNCRKQTPIVLKKVYWAGRYDDVLKKAIGQLKYKKQTALAVPLGKLLAKKFAAYFDNFDPNDFSIVPIPLHPAKENERGFNQAELIACSFANKTGIKIKTGVLKKIINTKAQAKIADKNERIKNLENAFAVDNDNSLTSIIHTTVILVDDVSTTGATLFHASKALSAAGIKNIVGTVVAHG